jgi:hypothetical protein
VSRPAKRPQRAPLDSADAAAEFRFVVARMLSALAIAAAPAGAGTVMIWIGHGNSAWKAAGLLIIDAGLIASLRRMVPVAKWSVEQLPVLHPLGWLMRLSASSLTGLAVLLAGRRRPALSEEWRAHLGGESGHDPATWPKVRQALGFIAAAIQFRLADAAGMAWRPTDAVLGSRTLSNLFAWGPVIVVLFAIVHQDGRFGLVADIQDPVALGAFLYGVIRIGRWWRGVKPPEPKARRARSDGGNG